MKIDENLINYLEDLSCLTLTANEKTRLADDLEKILACIERLNELDTKGGASGESVPERSHPFDNVNVFRDDEVCPSSARELILKNAAQKNDEMFIAPKTVE